MFGERHRCKHEDDWQLSIKAYKRELEHEIIILNQKGWKANRQLLTLNALYRVFSGAYDFANGRGLSIQAHMEVTLITKGNSGIWQEGRIQGAGEETSEHQTDLWPFANERKGCCREATELQIFEIDLDTVVYVWISPPPRISHVILGKLHCLPLSFHHYKMWMIRIVAKCGSHEG